MSFGDSSVVWNVVSFARTQFCHRVVLVTCVVWCGAKVCESVADVVEMWYKGMHNVVG